MKEVILVVDMLAGFLEEGYPLYCGETARAIIPEVVGLLRARATAPRIYAADRHRPDDPEFQMFPPHCIAGTEESELIQELWSFPGEIVSKTRYSAFYGTDLEEILKQLAPQRVILVGVCTDICVMYTAQDLRNRDIPVIVPKDCVASFDEANHRWALKHFERVLGVQVVESWREIPEPPEETTEEESPEETAPEAAADTLESVEVLPAGGGDEVSEAPADTLESVEAPVAGGSEEAPASLEPFAGAVAAAETAAGAVAAETSEAARDEQETPGVAGEKAVAEPEGGEPVAVSESPEDERAPAADEVASMKTVRLEPLSSPATEPPASPSEEKGTAAKEEASPGQEPKADGEAGSTTGDAPEGSKPA
jgi:nicotinamidase-related amidase